MFTTKFPDVTVTLSGGDGNAYLIIGKVRDGLRRAGHHDAAKEFATAAMASESYDDVIQLAMTYVDVA